MNTDWSSGIYCLEFGSAPAAKAAFTAATSSSVSAVSSLSSGVFATEAEYLATEFSTGRDTATFASGNEVQPQIPNSNEMQHALANAASAWRVSVVLPYAMCFMVSMAI